MMSAVIYQVMFLSERERIEKIYRIFYAIIAALVLIGVCLTFFAVLWYAFFSSGLISLTSHFP